MVIVIYSLQRVFSLSAEVGEYSGLLQEIIPNYSFFFRLLLSGIFTSGVIYSIKRGYENTFEREKATLFCDSNFCSL
ncbi:Replicase polyprotein 1ab [Dirofilaria immitis]